MERRGCGVGCIIASLGVALSCFLLPYLISSIYSIVATVLQLPTASTWLWGDWLGTVLGAGHPLYMFLAEGPICCVGILALLVVILGAVMLITGAGPGDEAYTDYEYEYAAYDDTADEPIQGSVAGAPHEWEYRDQSSVDEGG